MSKCGVQNQEQVERITEKYNEYKNRDNELEYYKAIGYRYRLSDERHVIQKICDCAFKEQEPVLSLIQMRQDMCKCCIVNQPLKDLGNGVENSNRPVVADIVPVSFLEDGMYDSRLHLCRE